MICLWDVWCVYGVCLVCGVCMVRVWCVWSVSALCVVSVRCHCCVGVVSMRCPWGAGVVSLCCVDVVPLWCRCRCGVVLSVRCRCGCVAPGRWPGPLWWLARAHTGCLRTHIPRHRHLTRPIPPGANPHRLLPRSLRLLCFSSPYLYSVLPESFLRQRHSACRRSCGSSTTSRRGRGGGFSRSVCCQPLCVPFAPGLCHRRLRTGATGLGWGHLQGAAPATLCDTLH